jgi:hypothetical protein
MQAVELGIQRVLADIGVSPLESGLSSPAHQHMLI